MLLTASYHIHIQYISADLIEIISSSLYRLKPWQNVANIAPNILLNFFCILGVAKRSQNFSQRSYQKVVLIEEPIGRMSENSHLVPLQVFSIPKK